MTDSLLTANSVPDDQLRTNPDFMTDCHQIATEFSHLLLPRPYMKELLPATGDGVNRRLGPKQARRDQVP